MAFRRWHKKISSPRIRGVISRIHNYSQDISLPPAARMERFNDRHGHLPSDPGTSAAIDACIDWLRHSQDHSASRDGGVAGYYSYLTGWSTSYPETTGYIIPTMLDYARLRNDNDARDRVRSMLDWLVSIQLPNGAFQSGYINSSLRTPVVFNTGQILLGLVAGHREFGSYKRSLKQAADWLVTSQDSDGCWRRYLSPYTTPTEKAHYTHVAWSLLEADSVETGGSYAATAMANIHWTLTHQHEDGFFDNCCLNDALRPLTHTLGYALRGIVEAYRASEDRELLTASCLTADGLLKCLGEDGFLPGRIMKGWRPAVEWACLTGTAQIACCWLALYKITGEDRYLKAGRLANSFVRRTIQIDGPAEYRGGVKGSYPIDGDYQRYRYINWATKFCIDSNLLEASLCC